MQDSSEKITIVEPPAEHGKWWLSAAAALERMSRPGVFALSLVLVALVALLDHQTGYESDFSVVYFGPVALATWFAGRKSGIWLSLIAAIVQAFVDLGSGHAFSNYAIPAWNTLARLSFLVLTAVLLSEVHRRLRVERHLARTDTVTGIMNLRAFSQRLDYSIALARRYNRSVTLAYFDMDNFKVVNDRYGHAEGDRLLRMIGETMTHFTRASDSVARLGGDEFAILLPNTGTAGAQEVLGKLREALSALRVDTMAITCSVGAVTFAQAPASAEEALRAADGLMYRVKYEGKNAVAFGQYDPTNRAVRILQPGAVPETERHD